MNSDDFQNLLALLTANPVVAIVGVIILLGTGGVGTALVQGRTARKLNIKGNALVAEKNSIDGFIGLSTIQETTITRQENTIKEQGEQIEQLQNDLADVRRIVEEVQTAFRNEIAYSNALETDRLNHGLDPMPRPVVHDPVIPGV